MESPLLQGPLPRPPRGFDPRSATPQELEKFHYPPCPDPESSPQQHAQWVRIASRCPRFAPTSFSEHEITGLEESRNWSGAVLQSTPPDGGAPFDCVVGSWIIPNPHPIVDNSDDDDDDDDDDDGDDDDDDDDDEDEKYVNGDYQCYTWIGLDGWTNHHCLKIGVVLDLKVEGGKVQSRSFKAAILFRGRAEKKMKVHVFDDFKVSAGDLVTGWVWVPDGQKNGIGWIYNEGNNNWSSTPIEHPKHVAITGQSAEWILAGKNPGDEAPLFPNYGATVFFHGLAHRNDGTIVSMANADIVSAQDVSSAGIRDMDGVIVHSAALF